MGGDEGAGILSDHYRYLCARQHVGVISAPGCSLEILPKIDPLDTADNGTVRSRLIGMLDVALGLGIGEGGAATMARQNLTLLDILIRLFADRLLAETRRGLPRAFLGHEDDLPALRGRLDVVRQFTAHAVRPDRLACRFDALSSDIPLLQIMKACVLVLRRHARSIETVRRLDELRFVLVDIADVSPVSLPWDRVRIDRSNRRWEVLLSLARLFMKCQWQATHHAPEAGQGITLLFPMNDLFEAYITALMARALRGTQYRVHAQGGRLFCLIEEGETGRQRFQTKPDLLIKRGTETVAIIDTKWKRLAREIDDRKHGVSQADVYQMMAYAQLYRCRSTMLMYPHHTALGEGVFTSPYTVASSENRLVVGTIDIVDRPELVRLALFNRLRSLMKLSGTIYLTSQNPFDRIANHG
jgi:5-methylcytosine-specific restriction enzyme subunit McrC